MKYSEKITENIYRIKVPFDGLFTSVFIIKKDDFLILADAATTKSDVAEYIIPAVEEHGGNLKCVFLSHSHGDHAGGYTYIKEKYPHIKVCLFNEDYAVTKSFSDYIVPKDKEIFYDCVKVLQFKGHSPDSLGLMDTRDNTLLTFDSFQLFGVGKYGTGLWNIDEYFSSLEKAETLDINTLVTAHDFYPLGSVIEGKDSIKEFIRECRECIFVYRDFYINGGYTDAGKCASDYNAAYPKRPTVSRQLFELIESFCLQNR